MFDRRKNLQISRLVIQFFVFDAKPILTTRIMKLGYNALTVAFLMLAGCYGVVVAFGY